MLAITVWFVHKKMSLPEAGGDKRGNGKGKNNATPTFHSLDILGVGATEKEL